MKEIEFRDVKKIYKPDTVALDGASFSIEKGEFVFVTGRSGSGKSTILKLMSGQIFPTSGEVMVRGQELTQLEKKEVPYFRRQFGIMQTDMGLLPERTVYQNIELAMYATEQPLHGRRKKIAKALDIAGIPKKGGQYPKELSGGEAARALLARALVMNPKILILDEPTANLDAGASWDLVCLLDDLNHMGITVVMASHDRELVTIMKKRVITLAAGTIVSDKKRAIYDSKIGDIFEERRILREREERKGL